MQVTGHRTRNVFERYNIVSDGDLRDVARKLGGGDVITTSGASAAGRP